MRKMATIQRLRGVHKHPNADTLSLGHINGWQVIFRSDEFSEGDLVVYCEIDSWVPLRVAPFLQKGDKIKEFNGVPGNRLKTIKLRGELSQGLALPMVVLDGFLNCEFSVGEDVSSLLGIEKWEVPVEMQLGGITAAPFPSLINKTDEERVQNLTDWKSTGRVNVTWCVTEKLEGTSCTFYIDEDGFQVCSRNQSLRESDNNVYWEIAKRYSIEKRMRAAWQENGHRFLAWQGEIIGPKIEGNIYNLDKTDWYFYYGQSDAGYFVVPDAPFFDGLHAVPDLGIATFNGDTDQEIIDNILAYADGISVINPNVRREGLVFRNIDDPSESFKAVSNKYLLGEPAVR